MSCSLEQSDCLLIGTGKIEYIIAELSALNKICLTLCVSSKLKLIEGVFSWAIWVETVKLI